uniref:Uncharacterized protein n=1 Tax=Ditylenchus dipsaci TaxID=166011 RepID=A0A915DL88_9BILA
MREHPIRFLNAEVYMRCIYAPEDLEKVVATGKAVVILKVIRSSKSKLNDKCVKAYLIAMEQLNMRREMAAQAFSAIHFVMDFSTRNKNYMAFHIYYQKEKLSRVLVIAEVAGILTPYSFEDRLMLQLDNLTKKMSRIEK